MTYNVANFNRFYIFFRRKIMCKCAVKKEKKSGVMTAKNSWRLNALYRIEKYIRELGQESRAKRMGYCGNTIFVKVKKGDPSNVLYQPQ